MLIAIILACLHSASWDGLPDWRDSATTRDLMRCRRPAVASYDSLLPLERVSADSLDSLYVRYHRIVDAALWPLEKVVPTAVELALWPLRDPVDYAERTDVVDRGVELLRWDRGYKGMLYPTMVMDGGQSSRLGATFIVSDLLAKGSYMRLSGSKMVNGDWYGSYAVASPRYGPLSTGVRGRVAASSSANASVWVPSESRLSATSSTGLVSMSRQSVDMGLPSVYGRTWIEPRWSLTRVHTGVPSMRSWRLDNPEDYGWFERGDRGIDGTELVNGIGLSLGRGSQDLEGTPTQGGIVAIDIDRSFSVGGGDVWTERIKATRYILLGTDRYVYRKGDLDFYRNFSPKALLMVMDPRTLRTRLTNRRVLALMFRASWMQEVDENDPASFYAFPTLGGSPPARAYGGGRLLDRAVAGGSIEYRWPIWRYLDGSVFTECAWAGPRPWEPDLDRVAPGAGVGLRVRTPRMFLFRGQFAYGLNGFNALVTVDPEF